MRCKLQSPWWKSCTWLSAQPWHLSALSHLREYCMLSSVIWNCQNWLHLAGTFIARGSGADIKGYHVLKVIQREWKKVDIWRAWDENGIDSHAHSNRNESVVLFTKLNQSSYLPLRTANFAELFVLSGIHELTCCFHKAPVTFSCGRLLQADPRLVPQLATDGIEFILSAI